MRKAIGYFGRGLLFLIIGFCLAVTVIPRFLDRIYYDGPVSAHYDGARFFNPDGDDTSAPPGGKSRGSFIFRWLTGANERAVWPKTVPVKPSKPAAKVEGDRMVVTWIGHATVLIQTQGINILTDPIWSDYAAPVDAFVKRVTEPGVRFDDLPKIDVVLVSHNHYDHMDLPTLKRLWDRDRPMFFTSLGNDAVMKKAGIGITKGNEGGGLTALDWGQGLEITHMLTNNASLSVFVTRNHHWGSRWGTDRNRALWSSFVVRLPGGNIFFAGDTGFGDGQWPAEAAKLGPVRFAMIPIGAFRFQPGQMNIGSHIGPIQAERVFAGLNAAYALPIHWGTFQLSNEARDTPPKMLDEVMKCAGHRDPAVFAAHGIGVPMEIPLLPKDPITMPPPPDPVCLGEPAITGLK